MRLSIAICTYNREEMLDFVLSSLSRCEKPACEWELLVVDNNSSDHTKDVANSYVNDLPLHYLFEQEQGLSAARNRALSECRGDWIIFTDDDVQLDPMWLKANVDAIGRFPKAGYLGGRVVPYWPKGRPAWLKDENLALISGLLVRYHQGESTRLYEEGEPTPFGASFGLSRKLFESIGKFRHDLGVKGNVPGRGEEAEYLDRALSAGWRGIYVGEAIAHHWTDANRLTISYLYRYGVQKGIAGQRVNPRAHAKIHYKMFVYLVKGILQLFKGRGDRFRQCVINVGIQKGLSTNSNSE